MISYVLMILFTYQQATPVLMVLYNTSINGALQHQDKPLSYSTGQPIMPEAGTAVLHSNALTEASKECNSAMNTPKKNPIETTLSEMQVYYHHFFEIHSISDS